MIRQGNPKNFRDLPSKRSLDKPKIAASQKPCRGHAKARHSRRGKKRKSVSNHTQNQHSISRKKIESHDSTLQLTRTHQDTHVRNIVVYALQVKTQLKTRAQDWHEHAEHSRTNSTVYPLEAKLLWSHVLNHFPLMQNTKERIHQKNLNCEDAHTKPGHPIFLTKTKSI